MKRFRLYPLLLAMMSLALLSPCGVAVQLSDNPGSKKAESKECNSFGPGMTTGLSAEPDSQSYFRRAAVSYTVNPFITLRLQTTSITSNGILFQSCAYNSTDYESSEINLISPRAPPCRLTN